MLAPMFSTRATTQDKLAIVKRAFAVVFGINRIYMRAPSASTKAMVEAFDYWPRGEEPDLLSPEGIAKLGAFRAGHEDPPASDQADRTWQLRFITLIIEGEPVPRLVYMTVTDTDDEGRVLMKEHVDRKPDIRDSSRPSLVHAGTAGSSTDHFDIRVSNNKRSISDANMDVVPQPSSREMMPPPPLPARATLSSRLDDPEIDDVPMDESDLMDMDQDDLDIGLADAAGGATMT